MRTAIYKIESPSGNIYIGQTRRLENRFSRYMNGHCQQQPALFRSFSKYGAGNHKFLVVHQLPNDVSQNVLDEYEILYHNQYKDCGFTMLNTKEPGLSGRHSPESVEKIRLANIGRKMKPHVNLLLQKARIGKTNTPEAIRKSNETKFRNGTHRHSDETKEKMRQRKLGTRMLPQTREAIYKSQIRPVIQLTMDGNFVKEFSSLKEGAESIRKKYQNIVACANGRQRSCGGFKWSYKN